MRKLLSVILSLVLAFSMVSLSACKRKAPEEAPPPPAMAPEPAPPPAEQPAPGAPAEPAEQPPATK